MVFLSEKRNEDNLNRIRDAYFKIKGGIFTLKGRSMEPSLSEGCSVNVAPLELADLRIGDLVVFESDSAGSLGCHRIIGKLKHKGVTRYLEKGDNNNYLGIILEDRIIGKVVSIIDSGKANAVKEYPVVSRFFIGAIAWLINCHNICGRKIKDTLGIKKSCNSSNRLNGLAWFMYGSLLGMFLKINKPNNPIK